MSKRFFLAILCLITFYITPSIAASSYDVKIINVHANWPHQISQSTCKKILKSSSIKIKSNSNKSKINKKTKLMLFIRSQLSLSQGLDANVINFIMRAAMPKHPKAILKGRGVLIFPKYKAKSSKNYGYLSSYFCDAIISVRN